MLYINMYCAKLLENEINGKECDARQNVMKRELNLKSLFAFL